MSIRQQLVYFRFYKEVQNRSVNVKICFIVKRKGKRIRECHLPGEVVLNTTTTGF